MPLQAVGRNAAVFKRRDLGDEIGLEAALFIHAPERAEEIEIDALIHLDMGEQRQEDRRFLRETDHRLSGRFGGRGRRLSGRDPA